jgi:hypothetical protein
MTNNELPKDTIGYITYWCNKYKSHITRRGKHDEKSQIKTNKQGKEYYVYYDCDKHDYRCATGNWKARS